MQKSHFLLGDKRVPILRKRHEKARESEERLQEPKDPTYRQVVYQNVRQIPPGQVASYGQIARLAGGGITARMVGYALASLPQGSDIPWQRVVNAQGRISLTGYSRAMQEYFLHEEGIVFEPDGHIDFEKFGWRRPVRGETGSIKK
jgi:methylated-DNA-protein-cysteine methyltransferase-like protein